MKKRLKVLFVVLCLLSSFTISHAIIGFDNSARNEVVYDALKAGPGSPIEKMPPQV